MPPLVPHELTDCGPYRPSGVLNILTTLIQFRLERPRSVGGPPANARPGSRGGACRGRASWCRGRTAPRDVPPVDGPVPPRPPAPARLRAPLPGPGGRLSGRRGCFGVVLIARGSEVGGGDERVAVGTVAADRGARALPRRALVPARPGPGPPAGAAPGSGRIPTPGPWSSPVEEPVAEVGACWHGPRARSAGSGPCCRSSAGHPPSPPGPSGRHRRRWAGACAPRPPRPPRPPAPARGARPGERLALLGGPGRGGGP